MTTEQTGSEVPATDEAAEAAYLSMNAEMRRRLRPAARLGRTVDSHRDAAVVSWFARRELARLPAYVALFVLLGMLMTGAMLLKVGDSWVALILGLGIVIPYAIGLPLIQRPRMRRAVRYNHEMVRRERGIELPEGRPADIGGARFVALWLVQLIGVGSILVLLVWVISEGGAASR